MAVIWSAVAVSSSVVSTPAENERPFAVRTSRFTAPSLPACVTASCNSCSREIPSALVASAGLHKHTTATFPCRDTSSDGGLLKTMFMGHQTEQEQRPIPLTPSQRHCRRLHVECRRVLALQTYDVREVEPGARGGFRHAGQDR